MIDVNEHIFLSFLAVLTLLCTACITGGWDECPPDPNNPNNLTIRLVFKESADLTPFRSLTYAGSSDWHNATLFVLDKDKDSVIVATWLDPLKETHYLKVKEDLGLTLDSVYRFVVWFNLDIEDFNDPNDLKTLPYRVKLDSVPPVFYVDIASLEGDSIRDSRTQILPTFHGASRDSLISTAATTVTIPVFQQTNDITVTVVGENVKPLGGEEEVYKFVIGDSSARYSFFDNKVLEHPKFYYVTRVTNNDPDRNDSIEATMRVLKLSADMHNPELTITNENGRKVFAMPDSTSLVSLIRGAYSNYPLKTVLDTCHNFNIKINLDEAHGITITVNGWDVVAPDGGFTLDK